LPCVAGGTWFLYPAIDHDWLQERGLMRDPEWQVQRVHEAKLARMEAAGKGRSTEGPPDTANKAGAAKEEEEQEEEEEAPPAEEEEEEEEAPQPPEAEEEEEDVAAAEGADEEEEEQEEESEVHVKPLYLPTKKDKLTPQEMWDNFTLKALRMDDEEEDEDEGTCVLCIETVSIARNRNSDVHRKASRLARLFPYSFPFFL
jgi:hypothetical protein